MDITDALYKWKTFSPLHTIKGENTEEGYWTYFMKDGVKMGYIKAVSGGIFWNFPEELMKRV
jgi:hypothetical protein